MSIDKTHIEPDFDMIYNKYIDDLYIYAQNLGFNKQLAMDAIHDVFCKLYTNKLVLKEVVNIKFYLFRALKNQLIDISRAQKGVVGYDIDSISNHRPFILRVTVEDELIEREDRRKLTQKVDDILSILTDRQREIIYLRFMQGYSYEEISLLMNISVPACHNLMSKTLKKLKDENLALSLLLFLLNC